MRYFETRKARIEIIPMIDIMLFLLVFFVMIALNMIPSTGLIGRLPASSTSQSLPPIKVLIEIHPDGSLVADQKPVSLAALREILKSSPNPDKTVVTIAGAGAATLQQLTEVMDVCRQSGITQIGLATRNVE
jgi:biopolymer transport protein ExbD